MQLPRFLDWFDFKLHLIDEHIAVLHAAAREAGFDGPISTLSPYLLPLQAAHFAAFARSRMPDLERTNECYVSLFSATAAPEQKVAHVIATHEAYHMWRGPGQGPAFSMELQGSNSSFISPGVMEMLYGTTIARGIRGWNISNMLVGGQNPAGYELGTGREYDLDAPIGLAGERRPHADVLRRQMRVVRALETELIAAEPLRDTWIAGYLPYEAAAQQGISGAFADARAAMEGIFSFGDIGLSIAPSLTALLTLAGASWGMIDLDGPDAAPWQTARQLSIRTWASCPRWCSGAWSTGSPTVATRCSCRRSRPWMCRWSRAASSHGRYSARGPSLVPAVPGGAQRLGPGPDHGRWLPRGPGRTGPVRASRCAEPLAWDAAGAVVGFRRPIGAGSASVLGFRLQYHPVGGADQYRFVADLVKGVTGPLVAVAEPAPAIALQLAGPSGGLVCAIDPVALPLSVRVTYTALDTGGRATFPERLPGIAFRGLARGCCPSASTWAAAGGSATPPRS